MVFENILARSKREAELLAELSSLNVTSLQCNITFPYIHHGNAHKTAVTLPLIPTRTALTTTLREIALASPSPNPEHDRVGFQYANRTSRAVPTVCEGATDVRHAVREI